MGAPRVRVCRRPVRPPRRGAGPVHRSKPMGSPSMRQPTRIQPPDTAMPSPAALRPPPTPGQLVQARRPSPVWPRWTLGWGIALLAARSMTADLQADTEARGQVLDLIRNSQPVGIALVAVGVLAVVIQVVVEPRGAAVLRVLSAAGKGMRLGPNQLTLRRTRWRRGWRKRRLVSGVLRYAPGEVTEDLGAELTEALGPFVAGDLLIRWEPDRDRFVLRQRPVTNPRREERHSTVGTMTRTLEHILGGLIGDQDQTNVSDSGEVSQFVATYPQTTRDLAESFRQRLKVILAAKTPCPTGYWMVKLEPASSRITVQPSQPMPRLAELPLIPLTPSDRMRIPVGVAAGGQIIHW